MITHEFISAPSVLSLAVIALLFSTAACSESSTDSSVTKTEVTETRSVKASIQSDGSSQTTQQAETEKPSFTTKAIAEFNEPWAMTALPQQDSESLKLLVTQKTGELFVIDTATGNKTAITGVP
ncbi:MAG: PQQ-dependent sugar dehydrogenase, partial [Psychrobacter sp.]|nr:PQQ-dependent sugar dehydrogenase [Psychrobacter sp.]